MKLRKLIVSGFKSFADKTEFEFDDGVSCIVGPNGCGKSNVVDAIKWVMGEQSAKSLRGGEMLDVIFNGSAARRPSGQASVTLEFDNPNGLLKQPAGSTVEIGESVSITRRLFRSGQSEYLINKQPARLRDIKDMFLDTGMGTNAYSIIEQGRISQFLQASQDERRAFFDEAAGISRYKVRKKEALRKLDRVEQNLLRVQDIINEVEKRLRSIKVQAGKARNYQIYVEQLRELRGLFFLNQYHNLTGQRKGLSSQLESKTDELSAVTSRISQLENAQSASEAETRQLEEATRQLQSQISTLAAQITTLQERSEMQTRRVDELGQQILDKSHRCEELEARIDEVAKDLAARQAESERVTVESEQLGEQMTALRDQLQDSQLAVTRLTGELEDEKNGVVDLLRRTQQLHNDVQTIGMRRQNLHGEKDRVSSQADELADQIESLLVEHAQARTRLDDAEEVIAESTEKLEEVKQAGSELARQEQDLHGRLDDARHRRSSLQGRVNTLEEMHQRMEGVGEGTRKVLEARRDGRFEAIRGMLGDFIETDVENAAVVQAALAGADQRLIATHSSQVSRDGDQLEALLGEGGSVEVICLDRIERLANDDASVSCPQAVARVLDWVRFEKWLEPLMWQLLGHTYVVRNLADALLAAEITPAGYRFITLGGEVLEPDGRVRFGAMNQSAGIIARRSELADLTHQLEELDGTIEQLQQQCDTTRQQREHVDEQVHALRTAVYEANFEKEEARKRLDALDEQIAERKRQQPMLASTLQQLEEDIEATVRREHETKEKAAELETIKAQRESHIQTLQQQLTEKRESAEALGEQQTELKVQLASVQQKKVALGEALATLKRQRESMDEEYQQAKNTIDLDRQRREQAEEEITRCAGEIEQLTERRQQLQGEADETEESRQSLSQRLVEIRQQLTERRRVSEELNQSVGNVRVKLSELDAHIGDLINRASDEMQVDLIEQAKTYEHDDQRDWDAVEAEIKELRGKIDRLGNVNLDAIGEQDELEQRAEFLEGQLSDIDDSRRQLEALIEKLNKESRDRFVETFNAVRENFQSIFRKLFGGGRADIILTDPEDVLESGIEVVAKPPGKELRSITLLSGGEKTMAALAMIFSFFRARPSPFCLLDEVDAALDEANTERYNTLVSEYLGDTQFIMISHAKRTMSVASVLYGVTMQEPGVSKRISVRFEEAAEMAEDGAMATA